MLICGVLAAAAAGVARSPLPAQVSAGRHAPAKRLATLRDSRITEASGIAAGRQNPDVIWVHNDSGDEPRLFAVGYDGNTRAVVTVEGAKAVDWEDLAAAPGPDGRPSLYIADTGNNERTRTDLCVYCIPEPDLSGGATEVRSERARVFPFRYPNGAHDCEALMVHPHTRRVYLVTKEIIGRPARVFRFPQPLTEGTVVTLEEIATVALPLPSIWGRMVTAADIAPDGKHCVFRTYLSLLEFPLPAGEEFEAALRGKPLLIDGPPEIQGETVTYLANSRDLLTIGEGRGAPLHLISYRTR
ncbi:MAG: hypothetical protein QHJ73_04735 [Armatimonadota bacterium]|nr:hypothetical protein [Armatimonadota bacterium]